MLKKYLFNQLFYCFHKNIIKRVYNFNWVWDDFKNFTCHVTIPRDKEHLGFGNVHILVRFNEFMEYNLDWVSNDF